MPSAVAPSVAAVDSRATAPAWAGSAAVVLGLLALWLLATAGLRPLLMPDEGRYAEVVREMLAGDGLVPLLDGLPFFHKPPLTYWVDMAGMALLGPTAFAARLGPALGAWLMGAALWLALRRAHGARLAGIGLLVLATCPLYFIGGQYANHDMLVAGTVTLAVLCLARALESATQAAPPPALRWLLAGWAACGLAVLAKGLIGVVLPALVIVPWLLAQRRWRDVLRLLHPLGLLVFAAVALPWYGLMQWRYPGFFDYFIVEQHFRRYASSGFNNAQPLWFYLAVLPALTLPWSAWLPAALRRRGAPWAAWLASPAGLMAWWVLAVLVFFSLPASKLVGYILPALAPWAALLAPALARGRAWRPLAVLAALLCLGLVAALAWRAPGSHRDVGLALRQQATAADLVVLVDNGFYDVLVEARLPQGALMASRWDDPELPLRDNWRKELADAARFDPAAAARLLVPLQALPTLVCRGQRVWLVEARSEAPVRAAAVPGASRVMQGRHAELWLAPPRACAAGGTVP